MLVMGKAQHLNASIHIQHGQQHSFETAMYRCGVGSPSPISRLSKCWMSANLAYNTKLLGRELDNWLSSSLVRSSIPRSFATFFHLSIFFALLPYQMHVFFCIWAPGEMAKILKDVLKILWILGHIESNTRLARYVSIKVNFSRLHLIIFSPVLWSETIPNKCCNYCSLRFAFTASICKYSISSLSIRRAKTFFSCFQHL